MHSVLIVEDDLAVAEILRRSIAPDCLVMIVGTATEGLAMLAQPVKIDIVILDVNLPDSKGAFTVSLFQSRFPNVPIFAVSGDPSLEQECIYAGAQSFLPKPQLSLSVSEIVRHIVERHRVRHQFQPAIKALEHAKETIESLAPPKENEE